MSLRDKAISGVFWTLVDSFVLRGLTFIATIILARWLGPYEFGIVGMIAVFIAIGSSISESGLSSSLIRTTRADNSDYSTVFILNLFLSLLVYFLLYFCAPLIADFFKQPVLTNVIRVYCLTFVLSAFSAVQLAILTAQMQFKQITKINVPGTVIGISVGLLLGYLGYGVWAIVFMHLVSQFVKMILLWLSSTWRPTLNYSKEKARYHYGFGYKLMLSGILNTIFQNIYNIVIGRYYSAKELGFFERSRAFNDYPVTTITSVITKVTYPLLSSLKDDKERISKVYKILIRATFFITSPLMFGASAIAYPLFSLVLGEQWLQAVPYFQVLCLAGMFYPIHAFNLNVFQVYGHSDLFLKLEVIKKTIISIALVIGFQYGIMGLVWSSVISNFLSLFVNTYYSSGIINYSSRDQFLDMLPTLFFSLMMFILVTFTLSHIEHLHVMTQIFIGSIVGGLFYFFVNKIFKTGSLTYLLTLFKEKTI